MFVCIGWRTDWAPICDQNKTILSGFVVQEKAFKDGSGFAVRMQRAEGGREASTQEELPALWGWAAHQQKYASINFDVWGWNSACARTHMCTPGYGNTWENMDWLESQVTRMTAEMWLCVCACTHSGVWSCPSTGVCPFIPAVTRKMILRTQTSSVASPVWRGHLNTDPVGAQPGWEHLY